MEPASSNPARFAARRAALVCAVAVIVLVAAGCRSGGGGPRATLDAYRTALDDRDYARAYSMMSARFRAQHSEEEFVRMMKDNAREVGETVTRLGEAHQEARVTAEFRYGLGDTMRLVREDDEWRIAVNPIQFYSQATPRDALRSFVRAYKLGRWDIMLRLVPDQYRERMDAKTLEEQFRGAKRENIEVMMIMLEANLDQPIEDKGNEARMPYGDRFEVEFVREDGDWKIKDPD